MVQKNSEKGYSPKVMPLSSKTIHVCLGGHDLEMTEIAHILKEFRSDVRVHDANLSWGARASAYQPVIDHCIAVGDCALLIELELDMNVPEVCKLQDWTPGRVVVIDHHNDRAGYAQPASLTQVLDAFEISTLAFPPERKRWLELVVANDVGHTYAMHRLSPPATTAEMLKVRNADRRAQGVSIEEEVESRNAVAGRKLLLQGRLTVVETTLSRTSAIADLLNQDLGGQGYEVLLISSAMSQNIFANGPVIDYLKERHAAKETWSGGALPAQGYWGSNSVSQSDVINTIQECFEMTRFRT